MTAKRQSVAASQRPVTASLALLSYDAEVDVKAEAGAFVFSRTKLYLMRHPVAIFNTPSGLHAESKILVDVSGSAAEQRVALYFDATTPDGLEIDFMLSLTPIDDHFQPTAPKKIYELKWTTSPDTPAFLDGPVYLKDLKAPSAAP